MIRTPLVSVVLALPLVFGCSGGVQGGLSPQQKLAIEQHKSLVAVQFTMLRPSEFATEHDPDTYRGPTRGTATAVETEHASQAPVDPSGDAGSCEPEQAVLFAYGGDDAKEAYSLAHADAMNNAKHLVVFLAKDPEDGWVESVLKSKECQSCLKECVLCVIDADAWDFDCERSILIDPSSDGGDLAPIEVSEDPSDVVRKFKKATKE